MSGARMDRMLKEHEHDTYKQSAKLSEPTVCPDCQAVYEKGHWQWLSAPDEAASHRCPACSRIHDRVPAGFLTLVGGFYQQHREEIENLMRHIEEQEKGQHPLNRIMAHEEEAGEQRITTTDLHLPRAIGTALEKAYGGQLDIQYVEGSHMVRVTWTRD